MAMIILTAGCAHRVIVPSATEIASIEVVQTHPRTTWSITEKSAVKRVVEICQSVPAVHPGILHAAVTYIPYPHEIRFKKTDGSMVIYELSDQSLHTQKATWPISTTVYAELTAILGIK